MINHVGEDKTINFRLYFLFLCYGTGDCSQEATMLLLLLSSSFNNLDKGKNQVYERLCIPSSLLPVYMSLYPWQLTGTTFLRQTVLIVLHRVFLDIWICRVRQSELQLPLYVHHSVTGPVQHEWTLGPLHVLQHHPPVGPAQLHCF